MPADLTAALAALEALRAEASDGEWVQDGHNIAGPVHLVALDLSDADARYVAALHNAAGEFMALARAVDKWNRGPGCRCLCGPTKSVGVHACIDHGGADSLFAALDALAARLEGGSR